MKKSVLYAIGAVLLIAALLLVGCQMFGTTKSSESSPKVQETVKAATPAPAETSVTGEPEANVPKEYIDGDVKVFEIIVKDMKFNPEVITVYKGDKLRLIVTAEDRTYDFQLAEYRIKETVEQGQTVTIEFTATMADQFSFFSRREWNEGKMEKLGTLVVKV